MKKLLELIEGMCLLFEDGNINDSKRGRDFISSIYKYVHSHRNCTCKHVHQDWRDEAIKMRDSLKRSHI